MEEQKTNNEVIIHTESSADDTVADDNDAKTDKCQKETDSSKKRDGKYCESVKNKNLPYGKSFTVAISQDVYYSYGKFGDIDERSVFVAKTFAILFVLLLITVSFCIVVRVEGLYINDVFFLYGTVLGIGSCIGLVAMSYIFGCVEACRNPPLIFLATFIGVILMTVLSASITVRYRTDILLIATVSTMLVVAMCIGIALCDFDFTRWWALVGFSFIALLIASFILLMLELLGGIRLPLFHLLLCLVMTVVLSASLVIQLQMILGGKGIEVDDDEYMMAAYMMYTSVVYIFINIVQITGILDDMYDN